MQVAHQRRGRGELVGIYQRMEGNPMRIVFAAAVAAVLCTGTAHAHMAGPPKKTLYQRLGGLPAITAVVDDFVGNVARDRRINKFFAKANVPRLKFLLVQQICQASGGPCTYTGRDMKSAHRGMGIADGDFNALVQDLGRSLNKFKVPAREQKELVAALAPLKKDIVERR
jgi:hemoglobin